MDILEKKGHSYELRRKRFDRWLESVPEWHDHFVFSPITDTNFTKPAKPLSESRVALISTAGIHLKSQMPFDIKSEQGDWSYRRIPFDTPPDQIMISDSHYDHSDPDEDINCIFPISHVQQLAVDGFIGSVASTHFGFMGFIPDPKDLMNKTAPEVVSSLNEDAVDIVFLTPG